MEKAGPGGDVERTVGLLAGDESAPVLAERLTACEELGFAHAVVLLEAATPQSVGTLAEAARLSRG